MRRKPEPVLVGSHMASHEDRPTHPMTRVCMDWFDRGDGAMDRFGMGHEVDARKLRSELLKAIPLIEKSSLEAGARDLERAHEALTYCDKMIARAAALAKLGHAVVEAYGAGLDGYAIQKAYDAAMNAMTSASAVAARGVTS